MGDWERRRDDPAAAWNKPRGSRGRKDRRRWCRGKEGVPHQPEVVLDSWVGRVCRETTISKWENYQTYRVRVVVGTRWTCFHIEQCVNCGKKLRHLTPEECPSKLERLAP